GDIGYTITTAPAVSADGVYNGLNGADVPLTNIDDDVAGITVSAIGGDTTEPGGTATFTIVLTSQPIAPVTIGLTSSDTTEGTLALTSVTFDSSNWSQPRTITVTGVDDAVVDGNITYSIITADATSTDPLYSNKVSSDVSVLNIDNDSPCV